MNSPNSNRAALKRKLAAYVVAAAAVGTASEAEAMIIGDPRVQGFGINGEVYIDFNRDGQTDFSIDHDQVMLAGGPTLNYVQIDKNDINGAANPLAFDPGPGTSFQATPFSDGATARNDQNNASYAITGPQGSYPAALAVGTLIGPVTTFDYQETDNFQGSGKWIRANRLIDQDATQIDQALGGRSPSGVQVPFNGPNFDGLSGEVQYLGVQMELNNAGVFNYGWIGIRITDEALATGEVVGYAYESTPGLAIAAGAIPEPGTTGLTLLGLGFFLGRRFRRRGGGR